MSYKKAIGQRGEELACAFLTQAGYTVTARNLYVSHDEIDIIAEDAKYIIFAVIDVESDFKPYYTSEAGARGLMQMVPDTFEWLTSAEHLGEDLSPDELYEPEVNIKYGTYYLSYLFEKFHDWNTVFAAYNAGEGNVAKWLEDDEYTDESGKLTHIPFKETRAHVKKINEAIDYYKNTYYRNEENTK